MGREYGVHETKVSECGVGAPLSLAEMSPQIGTSQADEMSFSMWARFAMTFFAALTPSACRVLVPSLGVVRPAGRAGFR